MPSTFQGNFVRFQPLSATPHSRSLPTRSSTKRTCVERLTTAITTPCEVVCLPTPRVLRLPTHRPALRSQPHAPRLPLSTISGSPHHPAVIALPTYRPLRVSELTRTLSGVPHALRFFGPFGLSLSLYFTLFWSFPIVPQYPNILDFNDWIRNFECVRVLGVPNPLIPHYYGRFLCDVD